MTPAAAGAKARVVSAFRCLVVGFCSLLFAGCERLWESREVVVSVESPLPEHCIETALDGVFGAGATRPNAQGTNYIVAAMPWEGYVRTHGSPAGGTVIAIELTRWNRYSRKEEALVSLLARAQAAVAAACGREQGGGT